MVANLTNRVNMSRCWWVFRNAPLLMIYHEELDCRNSLRVSIVKVLHAHSMRVVPSILIVKMNERVHHDVLLQQDRIDEFVMNSDVHTKSNEHDEPNNWIHLSAKST